MNKKIISLQSLKAIAFVCVFAQHSGLIRTGGFGVNLFLTLTGFLMYYNYHEKVLRCSFSDCIKFSANKISKLYLLNVITLILINLYYFFIINNANSDFILGLTIKFIIDLSMLEVWIPDTRWCYPLTGAAWYLGVYFFVCAMFPFLLGKIKKTGTPLAYAALCILLNTVSLILVHHQLAPDVYSWAFYICPLFRLAEFLAGCFLAKFYLEHKKIDNTVLCNILAFTSVGILVYFYTSLGDGHLLVLAVIDFVLKPLIALLMIYLFAIKKDMLTNIFSNKLFYLLGDLTPIAFLIHEPLIIVLKQTAKTISLSQNNQTVLAMIAFIGTIILSVKYRRCTRQFRNGHK